MAKFRIIGKTGVKLRPNCFGWQFVIGIERCCCDPGMSLQSDLHGGHLFDPFIVPHFLAKKIHYKSEKRRRRIRQFVKVRNHPVGTKFMDRAFGITEIDRDHWHARRLGGGDIGLGIADHQRA